MSARDRIVAAVAVALVLLGGSWFLVLSPQREQASSLAGQVVAQRAERDTALQQLREGLAAKQAYPRTYTTVARLGTAIPEDDGVASLLVQLQQAAHATQIDFRTLKIGSSSGAGAQAPPTPADPTQATTATLPPGAIVGAAGFPTLPFTFTFTGNFFHLSDFVGRLERFLVVRNRSLAVSGRFMTLDGIALTASQHGFPRIKASIAATTYLVPPTQGVTDGASASGPATAASSDAAVGQTASSGAASASSLPTATATPITP